LKPGALIVYGTCSVLREENEGLVEKFLAAVPGFTLEESLRVWPHRLEGGGFFGARLRKG
ncbi:MAG: RsmB/NOP family class I SAM-dependent RNA methyltransferase, partial [Archangium sp.]